MIRSISFTLTVGSYWPSKVYPSQIIFPMGGEVVFKTIEFDTDNNDPLKDAFNALDSEMNDTYHIWYWYWIDDNYEYHGEGVA